MQSRDKLDLATNRRFIMASEQDKIAHRLRLWVLPSMGMRIGVWDMSGICSLSPRAIGAATLTELEK